MEDKNVDINSEEFLVKSWVCEECGTINYADELPKECYACGAGQDHLIKNIQVEDLDENGDLIDDDEDIEKIEVINK